MKKLTVASRDFAYAQDNVQLGTSVTTQGTLRFFVTVGHTVQELKGRTHMHAHEHTH